MPDSQDKSICRSVVVMSSLLFVALHIVIMWIFFISFFFIIMPMSVIAMNSSPCRKMFPYGVSNFNQILMDNSFYIDKTIAIQKLEKSGRNLKLWRPRRCGKSLLCDQLKLYYDKLNAGSTVRFCYFYIN